MGAPAMLYAGAARRTINPELGTRQTGFRLFGNPVQAIESDLTATALVLGDGITRVVVIAIDLSLVGIDLSLRGQRPAQEMRLAIAAALGIPASHVMLNTSHTHAGVALPDYMSDTPEQMSLKERYRRSLIGSLVEAAVEADAGCSLPGSAAAGARARSASTAARPATAETSSARSPTTRSTPPSA